jgi:hypothetical protein
MNTIFVAISLVASLLTTSVQAMSVREFLASAENIPRNPTALLRSDARRLMSEMKGAFATVRAEQTSARQAGRTPASCLPDNVRISPDQILSRFNAIPDARRNVSVTQAVRDWMAERYPCPR